MISAFTLSASARGHPEAAELSRTRPQSNSYDRHEIHEPTSFYSQRQQLPLLQQDSTSNTPERYSSPASSQHRLRRTPKFEATPSPKPRLVHIAAASVGFNSAPAPNQDEQPRPSAKRSSRRGTSSSHSRRRRNSSQDLSEDPDEQSSEHHPSHSHSVPSPSSARQPQGHPIVRISRHTHSAILYALEEALRQPNPFSPDIAEETASMADLVSSGRAPATSNGHDLPAPQLPTAAPVPTGSPSGIRGPRMIMQERAAREAARQRAEAERIRAEAERKQLEQEREEHTRTEQEREEKEARQRRAGVAPSHQSTEPRISYPPIVIPRTPQPSHQRVNEARYNTNQQAPVQLPYSQQPPPQSQGRPAQPTQPQPPSQKQPESSDAPAAPSGSSRPRNSFPHAFERWETLSAHWEGLTSYWIRRLEQNTDDLNRDPLNQQLARQVTDLSAAGANLFHAVVELQRLRASSERKFQRWFFETRAELERNQEHYSALENVLKQERRNHEEAIHEAVEKDQGSSLAQKQLAEMRKELAISKDEARRAWEELGRREQAERDRTLSLQSGQPTIVGGVQVVPMTQSSLGRQGQGYQQSYAPEPVPSPTPAGGSSEAYYQQQPGQQQPGYQGGAPEHGYGEGEYVVDVEGNPLLDARGNRIPLAAPPSTYTGSDAELEEYETPATTGPPSGTYDPPPSTSAAGGQWTGAYSSPQDYSGEGYGETTYEQPTHHHPTRLSDVIEEDDERSRTSASQVSRG